MIYFINNVLEGYFLIIKKPKTVRLVGYMYNSVSFAGTDKRPASTNGHLSIRDYTDFSSVGLYFAYRPYHRINKNPTWLRRAVS